MLEVIHLLFELFQRKTLYKFIFTIIIIQHKYKLSFGSYQYNNDINQCKQHNIYLFFPSKLEDIEIDKHSIKGLNV